MFEKVSLCVGGLSIILSLVAVDLCFIGLAEFVFIEVLSLLLMGNAFNAMRVEQIEVIEEVIYEDEEWSE